MKEDVLSIFVDRRSNPRDFKIQLLLMFFRLTQLFRLRLGTKSLALARTIDVPYRLFSEVLLGVELRPKTLVGPGLTIYHGYGLVVNDEAVLGRGVVLRNGVVIGHRFHGDGCPIIGDNVEFGAGAVVVGPITIGNNVLIGPNAVVTVDVPDGHTASGNPAAIYPRRRK